MTCKQCTEHRKWRRALEADLRAMAKRWDEAGYVLCAHELVKRLSLGNPPAPTSWQEKLERKADKG